MLHTSCKKTSFRSLTIIIPKECLPVLEPPAPKYIKHPFSESDTMGLDS